MFFGFVRFLYWWNLKIVGKWKLKVIWIWNENVGSKYCNNMFWSDLFYSFF